ncbi:MAG: methylmalonyl-CoA epimerase [Chloroflexota bacterium]
MNLERVDHTAIAVRDLDEAIPRFERLFGVAAVGRAGVPDQHVAIAFLPVGDTLIELIQPTDANSGVFRFLEQRGEALHHVGLAVRDIDAELKQLIAGGAEVIDREPRLSPHGLVAFIHPRHTGGVLIELVQAGGEASAS